MLCNSGASDSIDVNFWLLDSSTPVLPLLRINSNVRFALGDSRILKVSVWPITVAVRSKA
jgi:hypothetical protein